MLAQCASVKASPPLLKCLEMVYSVYGLNIMADIDNELLTESIALALQDLLFVQARMV